LASTGMKRSRVFSELPTINETYPDFEASIWIGLFAPVNTPVATVNKLRDHVNKALSTPEVIESLFKSGGIEAFISTQEEFKALILRDQKKYSKIIQSLKIKVD
jgi:tripartite-type tricarboxylate transporter receptor subunit TctC